MGLGITNTALLEAEKLIMKPAISNALIAFYATLKDTPITGDQYAIEFADVLVDTMFDRIVTYIATNANVITTVNTIVAITAPSAASGTGAGSGTGSIL